MFRSEQQGRKVQFENRIINMTDYPIHLYDDATGVIETFYPNVWTFCKKCNGCSMDLFPRTACYVFSQDMEDDILRFEANGYSVAVINGCAAGRDGIMISALRSSVDDKLVIYRKKQWFKRNIDATLA